MKTVYLLIGPRASGKSTYAEKIIENQPNIVIISRDRILEKNFGGIYQSPYNSAHFLALEMMYEEIEMELKKDNLKLILDCFLPTEVQRRDVIQRIREKGFNKVVAMYFKTPVELVQKWFWLKPGIKKTSQMRENKDKNVCFYTENAPVKEHGLFHEFAMNIDQEGFDEVIVIEDPRGEVITLY